MDIYYMFLTQKSSEVSFFLILDFFFEEDQKNTSKKKRTTRGSNFAYHGHFRKKLISSIMASKKLLDFNSANFLSLMLLFPETTPDVTSYVCLSQKQQQNDEI